MKKPGISIILTAYKEPKTISRAIEQILKNNLSHYELIVTAPDDGTLNVAKKYSKKIKNLILFKDRGEGKPTALTDAFKIAKGNILVLTDGDVYIKENSIDELIKHFSDSKVGAVSGHPVPVEEKTKMMGYWAYVLMDIAHKIRKERDRKNKFLFCTGYLFAMRNNLVNEIPSSVLDDSYISQIIWQKSYKIKYEENAIAFIKNPDSFKDWIKQKKRNTFGEFQLRKTGKSSMRGFKEESSGVLKIFAYPKNITQIFWLSILILARLYVWINAVYNAKIKKSHMKKIWVRVETTK